MSETEIKAVRRKIGDSVKSERENVTGTGRNRIVKLQNNNVFAVFVTIDDVETTGFTVHDTAGRIVFAVPPAEGSSVIIDYLYAAYTDAELQSLIDDYGVNGAAIACLEELLVDTARFYDFTQGETTEKRSQVFENLNKVLTQLKASVDTNPDGSNVSSGVVIGKRSVGGRRAVREAGHKHDGYASRRP